MAQLAEGTYAQDEIWISQQSTRDFFVNGIGLPDWFIDGDTPQNGFINFFKEVVSSAKDDLKNIKEMAPDSEIRNAMINRSILPVSIQGNPNYLIRDLYKDK